MKGIAVVTGASRGIGMSIAKSLASNGYSTILVSRIPLLDASSTMNHLASISCDLSKTENIPPLCDQISQIQKTSGN